MATIKSLPIIFLFSTLLIAGSLYTSAKRGCSSFGHSCYGGHGKRSTDNNYETIAKGEVKIPVSIERYIQFLSQIKLVHSGGELNNGMNILVRKLISKCFWQNQLKNANDFIKCIREGIFNSMANN